MKRLRAALLRVAALFRRDQGDADFAAELDSHLQMHIEENVRAGMSAEQARRDALMKLGGIEQTREMYRDRRGLPWLEAILQDLRFAARMMRKNPVFTAMAILTLALGIGANSAVFSIVNAVMLRPLPYKDSDRLVSLSSKTGMFPDLSLHLSWPAFQKVRKQVASFEASAVNGSQSKALTGRGEPQLLSVATVSDQFFEVLGAKPLRGRLLSEADREEENGKILVLSEALWRTRFGGDARIVGQTVVLDKEPYTIVGVAGEGFGYPEHTDAWAQLVLAQETKENPTFYAFDFLGKLKRGADLAQLNAELKVASSQLEKEYPRLKDGYEMVSSRLIDGEVGDSAVAFYVLLGAATLLLLIACTNIASMLLSRGWSRQQELAVRAALGASRGRLLRQMLVESCLLGLCGGAAGIVLATLGVHVFRVVAPEDTPRLGEIHADWVMVAFAIGSALLTGVVFGFAPARLATRVSINKTIKEGGGARSLGVARASKMGGLLVAGEIALVFVLLIGAALMTQTLWRLLHQDTGFRTDNLLAFDLYRSDLQSDADRARTAPAQIAQTKAILESVRELPGIQSVAAVNYGLLTGTVSIHGGLHVDGSSITDRDSQFAVTVRCISPSYFETLGLVFPRGRNFTEHDAPSSASVAIVNERMARRYWGTLDVLGKRLSNSTDANGKELWSEIVGVVSDARDIDVKEEARPEYYIPLFQCGVQGTTLLVRTERNSALVAGAITKRIWAEYPDLPVTNIMTVRDAIEKSVGNERLHAALLAAFAGIGLLIALAGTYGVIAYAVERRTQEIGIRIALGASRKDVLLLVSRQALLPVLAGIVVGIPVALGAERAIASELYGVKATDPLTFALGALLMVAVAALACWVPGRRAMRVDPMIALRYE